MLPPKPWHPDAVLRLVLWLFVSISVGSLAVMWLNPQPGQPLTGLAKFAGFLIGVGALHGVSLWLIYRLLKEYQISWKEAFGFDTPGVGGAIRLGIVACLVVLPVTMILAGTSKALMELMAQATQVEAFTPVDQQAVQTLRETEAVWQQVIFGAFAVLMAPVVEEMLFRGILYPVIKQNGWPRAAWWGTSFIFALTHANAMTFVSLFVLSMALIWLYERTANLLAPVVAHSLFNGMNLYWLLAGR